MSRSMLQPRLQHLHIFVGKLGSVLGNGTLLFLPYTRNIDCCIGMGCTVKSNAFEVKWVIFVDFIDCDCGCKACETIERGSFGSRFACHDMVIVEFIRQPWVTGHHKIRARHSDMLDNVAAHIEIIVLSCIGITEPVMLFYADNLSCFELIILKPCRHCLSR